jgi:hypothetical protein
MAAANRKMKIVKQTLAGAADLNCGTISASSLRSISRLRLDRLHGHVRDLPQRFAVRA